MFALSLAAYIHMFCGNYSASTAQCDELVVLAEEKGALLWKAEGTVQKGCVLALTGKPSDAVQMVSSGIAAWRSTGATQWMPFFLSTLAVAYAELDEVAPAWRCVGEAETTLETTNERWWEAEVNRTA